MGRSAISKCNKRIIVLKLNALHISFVVNLLARFSYAPTQRHWSDIKTIFRYRKGTIDLGLFYPYREKRGIEKETSNLKGTMSEWTSTTTVDRSKYDGRPVELRTELLYSLCRKSL